MISKPGNRWRVSIIVGALLLLLLPLSGHAGDQDQRRLLIGLKIFPAILAADSAITQKVDNENNLSLLLLYQTDRVDAERLAARLNTFAPIRGLAIRAHIAAYTELTRYDKTPPAGIFLTESSPEILSVAVAFGERHHVLIFSPFQEDVERGATTGLYVSDQILPYVNMKSLEQSGITLRPFFLEVAKHYD